MGFPFRQIKEMTVAVAIRGPEFIQRKGRILQDFFNFRSSSTLIEKFAFYPDFLDLGFLEQIVNMPEGFFLLTQVAFYPTLKTTSGSSYIKIDSLAEFFRS